MATVGQADIEVGVSGVGAAQSALGSLGGTLTNLGRTALAVGAVGLAVLGTGLSIAASEAMEAQKVMAQTNAVIESTKGAAGMSAAAIADMATNLQNMSGVADDAIQAGENMLLTFTNIGSSVFPQATQTMLDMSVALGQDLKSSAIQLGKALNDPLTGITALQRVGVTFNESQKALIASMMKAGDVMGAQKVILAELNKEFGGSAAAAGQTLAGQLEIAKLKLLDVAEAAGNKLLPSLSALMTTGFPLVEGFALGAADVLASFGDALVTLTPTINDFMNTLDGVFFHLKAGWSPLMILRQLFPQVFTPEIVGMINNVGDSLGRIGVALSPAISTFIDSLGNSLKTAFDENGPQIITNITTAFDSLATFFETNGPAITTALDLIGKALGSGLAGGITLITGLVSALTQLATGDIGGALNTVGGSLMSFADGISQAFGGVDFSTVLAQWGGIFANIGTIISVGAGNAIAAASTFASGIVSAISGGVSSVVNVVSDAINAAIAAVLALAGNAAAAGASLAAGIASGIKGAVGSVIDAAVAAVEAAIAAAKAAAGISSPSKVMRKEVGGQIGAGMALGISDMMSTVMSAMAGLTNAGMQPVFAGASGGVSNVSNRGGDTNHNYITIMAQNGDNLQDLMMQAQQLQGDA